MEESQKDSFKEALEKGSQISKILKEAIDEENRIVEEMINISKTTSDQVQADKIIFEKIRPRMEEISKKISKLKIEWFETIKDAQDEYKKTEEERILKNLNNKK